MKLKHIQHNDGEEWKIPLDYPYYVTVCCDCCLIHKEVYTIRDGRLFYHCELHSPNCFCNICTNPSKTF